MLTFKRFILEYFLTEAIIDDVKKHYSVHKDSDDIAGKIRKASLLTAVKFDSPMASHIVGKYGNGPELDGYTTAHSIQNRIETNGAKPIFGSTLPSHHVIDKLAEGDPSKDKKHLPHIARWYAAQDFRAEDLGSAEDHAAHKNPHTVHGVLSNFSDIKNKDKFPNFPHPTQPGTMLKGTSLKSYAHMSFPKFRSHVNSALGLDKASGEAVHDHPDMELLDEHNGTKLYHINSKSAAIHAAKCARASWCTGWEGGSNMFHHYNNDGNIYLLHGHDGHFHQIHKESHQIMDKNDEAISPEELKTHYPEITKFKHINKYVTKSHDMPFADDKTRSHVVKSELNAIKNNKEPELPSPTKFIAKNGNHEQLKSLVDHIDQNLSRNGVVGPHYRAPHAMAQARRITEFGEDLHPFKGAKGTPEHLANMLDRHEEYKRIINELPLASKEHTENMMKKHMELGDEFEKHFPNHANHSLDTVFRKSRMDHIKTNIVLPKNNLLLAKTFLGIPHKDL